MERKVDCHLCGGKTKLKSESLSLDDGKIIIKDSPHYECIKCGEAFSTSEQMRELSERINTKFVFQRPIINAGRSLAITLPADLVQFYNLKRGKKIKIIPQGRHTLKVEV